MKPGMKKASAALACVVSLVVFTGCPTQILQTCMKTLGGEGDDGAHAVVLTANGGMVIAGFTEKEAIEDDNALLVKLDAHGHEVWRAEFGDDRDDVAYALAHAHDGGYVIAGRFGSDFDETSDGFLIKTDKNGTEQWRVLFDSGGHDTATSVVQTTDGGYLVGVQYDLLGDSYAAVIKVDAFGETVWQTDAGPFTHIARAIATSDGGAALGWWQVMPGELLGSVDGAVGILKVDANGVMQWIQSFHDNKLVELEDIQQTSDGGYVLTGEYDMLSSDSSLFLWRLDASGETVWEGYYNLGLRAVAHRVRQTFDGGFILTGAVQAEGQHMDMLLLKVDAHGHQRWARAFGGDDADAGFDVVETRTGFIAVGMGESFEAEDELDHKQIIVLKTNHHGWARNGEVPLPEHPAD